MLDGREWLGLALGEFVPLDVTPPSGATMSPDRSLVSPGGVELVPCVFCVVEVLWELEPVDWAVAMPPSSSAIEAK